MSETSPENTGISSYKLALCRPDTQSIFTSDGQFDSSILASNIQAYVRHIETAATQHDAKMVVFPQFGLSSFAPVSNAVWVEAALDFEGAIAAPIAQAAKKFGIYVVVQSAEKHSAFPDRYFLSAAVYQPDGTVGMVHRKNYTISMRTSPIDVHDQFLATFGHDAFLPVLHTPLGGVGIAIGAEVHWPEAIRSLALKGAEVILNPIACPALLDYLGRPGAQVVRSVRAFENVAYVATCNVRGDDNTPPQTVYDYKGGIVGDVAGAENEFLLATIELAALREYRTQLSANLLAELQPAIHTDLSHYDLWPKNAFAEAPASGIEAIRAISTAAQQRLTAYFSPKS